ncbi:MAG: lipopolysaccharide heptosyltransferase II [Chloroflexi bacterium]|nr:lipopolysaccharide heptosyltransferase II [Chloroflexota bacterium]
MEPNVAKPSGARNTAISAAGSFLRIAFAAGQIRRSSKADSPRSVLVIKLCCLGDVLMATPTLRALRETFPEAHIAIMVSSWAKGVLEGNPNIDEVIDCGPFESFSQPRTYFSLLRSISRRRFDCAVVLERSPRLTVFPYLAGIPQRAGLDSFGRGFSLNKRVSCDQIKPEVELYLDVARQLGCEVKDPWIEFHPTEMDNQVVDHLLASLSLREGAPLVAIHVGGGANPGMEVAAKRWPPAQFAELADRIATTYGAEILILGAARDRPTAGEMLSHLKAEAKDLVGQLDLGEVAALCQRCSLYLGNDTGVTHLAAATGTPVAAIFGPSSPVTYRPYGPRVEVVWRAVDCNPCFRFGSFNKECRNARCIEAVTVDDVWQAVERLLKPS